MRFTSFAITALATCAIARPSPMAPVVARSSSLLTEVSDLLDPSSALDGLSAQGAAAFVGAGLGLESGVISVDARTELNTWIGSASAELDSSVITSLQSWCTGSSSVALSADVVADISLLVPFAVTIAAEGGLQVETTGITSVGTAVGVVLETSLQSELEAYIKANTDLDSEVLVALNICAAGGVVSSISSDIISVITAWLSSSSCTLSADLKAAIKLWISGTVGTGVSALGSVSTDISLITSIGASINAAVDSSGIVASSYISSLEAWISSQTDLDADIKGWLAVCTAAKGAINLDVDAVGQLTAWLFDSSCTLTAELKAVVLLWLHVRVTVSDTISVLSSTDISTLSTWISGEISSELSSSIRGVIAVAIAGEAVVNVSVETIAEVIAVITGCVSGIDVSVDIEIIIAKWISGETCDCHATNSKAKRALAMHA